MYKIEVTLELKLGKDVEPRYLEDEGIFVGRVPYVTRKNRNMMEHRVLSMPDQVNKNK